VAIFIIFIWLVNSYPNIAYSFPMSISCLRHQLVQFVQIFAIDSSRFGCWPVWQHAFGFLLRLGWYFDWRSVGQYVANIPAVVLRYVAWLSAKIANRLLWRRVCIFTIHSHKTTLSADSLHYIRRLEPILLSCLFFIGETNRLVLVENSCVGSFVSHTIELGNTSDIIIVA